MSIQIKEVYSDFDILFRRNALTGDVIKKKNLDDIRQSLGLLLNTRYYDRCWKPQIGSYLPTFLFDQDDYPTKQIIKDQITTLIENYEPRITLESIEIYHANKEDENHGKITISIKYTVNNLNLSDTYIYNINRIK